MGIARRTPYSQHGVAHAGWSRDFQFSRTAHLLATSKYSFMQRGNRQWRNA